MPLGDSITLGTLGNCPDTEPGCYPYDSAVPEDQITGYRLPLHDLLAGRGYNFTFVGSLVSGQSLLGNYAFHEGHPGAHAGSDVINSEGKLVPGIALHIQGWLISNPSDVILLHIGTNDIASGTQNPDDVRRILQNIFYYDPEITVLVARILKRADPEDSFSRATVRFNDAVEDIVNGFTAQYNVAVVDQENALDYPDDMASELHPNQAGYEKMAGVWFDALQNSLSYCGGDLGYASALNFGAVLAGSEAELNLLIRNNGNYAIPVGNLFLDGRDSPDYALNDDGCSGRTLGPSEICNVRIIFSTESEGSKYAEVKMLNMPKFKVALNGTGSLTPPPPDNLPTAPSLVSPGDGQTDLDTSVTFSWKQSSDPDEDPLVYNLYCCEDPSFGGCAPVETALSVRRKKAVYFASFGGAGLLLLGMVFTGRKSERVNKAMPVLLLVPAVCILLSSSCRIKEEDPVNDISRTISGLRGGTTYYWKVVADDGKPGGTAESDIWKFHTK